MSTHMPGFQSFFRFFASFCIGHMSHQQYKGLVCVAFDPIKVIPAINQLYMKSIDV